VFGFFQIINAVFIPPPAKIFNGRSLQERNIVGVAEFNHLDFHLLVMRASDLCFQ
jgi:hypothetical protein